MKKPVMIAAFAFGVLAISSCMKDDNNNSDNDSPNTTDRNFVVQASYSNKDEITAGTLASSKAQRDSIRMFGQMMITDHTKAQSSLDSIGTSYSITIPPGPDSIHAAMAPVLMGLSGHAFDSAYIKSQVMDHQNTINLFQDEINNGNNQRIRNFATMNLPVIQMHYNMAVSLSQFK